MAPPRSVYRTAPSGHSRVRLAAEPALQGPSPALARGLDRDVDRLADDQALAADLAEHRERHVLAPRHVPQPAEVAAAERRDHARLALAEEERVEPDPLLQRDPHAEPEAAERALRERDGEAALADVVQRAQETLARGAETHPVQALLGFEIDPRRRAADDAVDDGEVLRSAELLARAAEQDDHVAVRLPPRREMVLDVVELSHHRDHRRRRNALALGLIVEAHV